MKAKLKFIIPVVIAIIAIIVAALCIDFTPQEKTDVSSLMSTAHKYLIENQYEQAIAEFNKVIEIEPMNVDAYLGLAEAYVGIGDTDKAIEVLEKGYEITGDDRLKEMLDRLLLPVPEETTVTTTAAETDVTTTVHENKTIPNEELVQVLMQLIENPNANIEKEKLDAIYKVSIWGKDFYAVNENIGDKYSISARVSVYDDNHLIKNRYGINYDNTEYEEYESGIISNLTFLERLNNLSIIEIEYNEISDISSLSGMTNLTILILNNNKISDISALENLTNLTDLWLEYNQINDISALENLTNLTDLWLEYNQINDISALENLTNLKRLELDCEQISNISPLKNLTNLELLNLNSKLISEKSEKDVEDLRKALPNCYVNRYFNLGLIAFHTFNPAFYQILTQIL
ncbi:MAG: tetratricopeptide repeat protein [Ruminococcus sp.]|nr:tetratricopeptide repeat protein [Ruminococcus sp.]